MEIYMKKTVKLLPLFILIFITAFLLSSCMIDFKDVLAPGMGDEAESPSDDGSSAGENKENNSAPGSTGGESDGSTDNGTENEGGNPEDPIDGGIEFYPGSGEDINITAPTKSLLSVVSIASTFEASYGRTQGSVGSGVIYKLDKNRGDAYIITNFHVVYNRYAVTEGGISDDIGLYLYGMELEPYKIKAEYVGGSLTQDLALLKVTGSEVLKNSFARAADLGDSDTVSVMDDIIVVGNPEGFGISVTTGIISVDSENLDMTGADGQTGLSLRVIRFDAAVNEGNSGGGLFNSSGNLIGIVNAKRTGSDVDNIAYAIPLSYAKNFVDNIIYYCDETQNKTPSKILLGVTVTNAVIGLVPDESTGALIKAELVEVSELSETSPLLGKLSVGDRLLSVTVDGIKKEITRSYHLIDHVLTARVGSTVIIEATRNGEKFTVEITVPESALVSVR